MNIIILDNHKLIIAELKRQVQKGEFLLTVPSAKLPLDTVKHVLHASDEIN